MCSDIVDIMDGRSWSIAEKAKVRNIKHFPLPQSLETVEHVIRLPLLEGFPASCASHHCAA